MSELRVRRKLPASPERVLVVETAHIGDTICATPAIAAVRNAYPNAHLAVLATAFAAPVLEHHPGIDQLIAINKRKSFRSPRAALAAARILRDCHFDVAFLLHNSLGSALLAFLAGIPHRVGYNMELRGPLLTISIRRPPHKLHLVDLRLGPLKALGLDAPVIPRVYYIDESAVPATLSRLLPDLPPHGKLLTFVIGSTWASKEWPVARFRALSRKLKPGSCTIALVGDKRRRESAATITADGLPIHNLVGKTDLHELGHLLYRSAAVVTPDSGPMHMAAGLGKPVIALFGPTNPDLCGMRHPGGLHLRPPRPCHCRYRSGCTDSSHCLSEISEDLVLEALSPHLEL